ncbi:hypothetical protein IA69_14400 [Massilia sp. JS1662]|nr:hypothetical protein [Massilia sp. JS1662]KGF81233.1 hypothetical protein IA69_14400 [Massilia sp. JS1662]
MIERRRYVAGLIAVTLFAVLLWLQPLLTLRLPHQVDLLVHLRWSDQFFSAVRDGWLLPRWAYASHGGLGDPTFMYYQPLFYYVTSAFALAGLESRYALLWGALVPYALLGAVVYFGMLRHADRRSAVLGACFVMCCPVLLFLSAQMAAFPWVLSIPFSVLFLAESGTARPRVARVAVLLCLVCLSHLLSGMIALFTAGLGRLVLAFPNRRTVPGHVAWALGVALGLGLAAFFVYPAVTQLNLINPTGWTDGPNFDWRRAFALPVVTFARYGLRWAAIQWPLSLLALGMCAVTLWSARGAPAGTPQALAFRLAVFGLTAIALGSELAYPLYALLSPLQKLQFPYRFMFIGAVLGSIGIAIQFTQGMWSHWNNALRALVLALVAVYGAQALYLQWSIHGGEGLPARGEYMQGRFGQPEYVPAVARPQWKTYLETGKLDGECRRLGLTCDVVMQRTNALKVVMTAPHQVAVRMPLFAFPAWRASVDGQTQSRLVDEQTGLALVHVGPGRHVVAMEWDGLPADTLGRNISLASVIVLLLVMGIARLRRRRQTATSSAATAKPDELGTPEPDVLVS